MVELGYRGTGETLKREDFEARKKAERERNTQKANVVKDLASAGKDVSKSLFLSALANREELVRSGKLTVGFLKFFIPKRRMKFLQFVTLVHHFHS